MVDKKLDCACFSCFYWVENPDGTLYGICLVYDVRTRHDCKCNYYTDKVNVKGKRFPKPIYGSPLDKNGKKYAFEEEYKQFIKEISARRAQDALIWNKCPYYGICSQHIKEGST